MAEAFEIKAKLRYLQITPQKVRLVVDTVRGKNAREALDTLRFMPQRSAGPVYKLIASAVANAENAAAERRERINTADVVVSFAVVNEGRTLRRFIPGARGRAMRTRSRSSQVHLTLSAAVAKKKK